MQSKRTLASALLLGILVGLENVHACSYEKHASQVLLASASLRVSLTSAGVEEECAKMAAAHGFSAATVRTVGDGQQAECSMYAITGKTVNFQVEEGAISMSSISDCDTAAIALLNGQSLELIQAAGDPAAVRAPSTATTTAYARATREIAVSAAEAAHTRRLHASDAARARKRRPRRARNEGPAKPKIQAPKDSKGNKKPAQKKKPKPSAPKGSKGNKKPAQGKKPSTPKGGKKPVQVKKPKPSAPKGSKGKKKPAQVKKSKPSTHKGKKKPAQAKKPSAPKKKKPLPAGKTLEQILNTDVGDCGPLMSFIPTGRHLPELAPPQAVVAEYTDLPADGKIKLNYDTIKKGGEYCVGDSKAKKVIFGGKMFWKDATKCHLPPTNANGSPCCEMYMWQPNSRGFYYSNCSMRMAIKGDGSWWFKTELPGDESLAGWGPDPAPHIHYDIRCKDCQASGAFPGTKYQYWSKFYAEDICTLEQCGNVKATEHKSKKTKGPNGETVYKYNFVLPPGGK